jgi:hypothetical protein
MPTVSTPYAGSRPNSTIALFVRSSLLALSLIGGMAVAYERPSNDEFFEWAERTYPAVFPTGPATVDGYDAQGKTYFLRKYAGDHVLALDKILERVIVFGPLTGYKLQDVGHQEEFTCLIAPTILGCPGAPWQPLNDTGIDAAQCYLAGSDSLVSCASAAAIALNSKQDGMVGRDVTRKNTADGILGFSYAQTGNCRGISPCPAYPVDQCVYDQVTGLTWEGKPLTGFRAVGITYTNLGDNSANDASTYVAAVNASRLCGYADWRLPTVDELQGLVDYGMVSGTHPAIDTTWFTNAQNIYQTHRIYWTDTRFSGNSDNAWGINFAYGTVSNYSLGTYLNVRLVRW